MITTKKFTDLHMLALAVSHLSPGRRLRLEVFDEGEWFDDPPYPLHYQFHPRRSDEDQPKITKVRLALDHQHRNDNGDLLGYVTAALALPVRKHSTHKQRESKYPLAAYEVNLSDPTFVLRTKTKWAKECADYLSDQLQEYLRQLRQDVLDRHGPYADIYWKFCQDLGWGWVHDLHDPLELADVADGKVRPHPDWNIKMLQAFLDKEGGHREKSRRIGSIAHSSNTITCYDFDDNPICELAFRAGQLFICG